MTDCWSAADTSQLKKGDRVAFAGNFLVNPQPTTIHVDLGECAPDPAFVMSELSSNPRYSDPLRGLVGRTDALIAHGRAIDGSEWDLPFQFRLTDGVLSVEAGSR